jgi:hypothetical protein
MSSSSSTRTRSGKRMTDPPSNKKRGKGLKDSTTGNNAMAEDSIDEDDEIVVTATRPGVKKQNTGANNSDNPNLGHKFRSAGKATPVFKVVDPSSKHRRHCKRFGDELRSRTPDRNNLSRQKHKLKTRLTFRISVPATEKPEEAIISIFSEFFQEIKKIDSTLAIMPWKDSDRNLDSISKENQLPTTIKTLRPYLNKFYIGKKGNQALTTYPGIFIGHDKRLPEIREELQSWLNLSNHGLFEKMLQAESVSDIGWMLYSTKEMDAGALVDEIADLIGVQVGLRWKIIDTGAKGKLPETQRIQALNVEVCSTQRWEAQRNLQSYFGKAMKNLEDYPNGIRLRFVKSKRDAINTNEKGKIERLRQRQKIFLNNITSSTTLDIVQLDYARDDESPTLRQMIMSLKTRDTGVPLFHCVDLDWRGDGYIFQYSPQVKEEAECAIHTLYPLTQHYFPEAELEDSFTSETAERCVGYKYDPVSGTVVDETVGEQLNNIDDDNLLGFTFDLSAIEDGNEEEHSDEMRPSGKNYDRYFPHDNDSVSTFGRPKDPEHTFTPIITAPTKVRKLHSTSNDSTSVTSIASTVTMEETIHSMNSQIRFLTAQGSNINQKFDAIMEKLGMTTMRQGTSTSETNGTSLTGTNKAGSENNSPSGGVP